MPEDFRIEEIDSQEQEPVVEEKPVDNPAENPKQETVEKPQDSNNQNQVKNQDSEPAQPTIDFSIFGDDIKSMDDLKNSFSIIKSERDNLNGQLEQLKGVNPYSDETLFKLNHIKTNNPDNYGLATKLAFDSDSMDPIDLLILKKESESPAFSKYDAQDKRDYIQSLYKLSHDLKPLDPDTNDPEDVQARNVEIQKLDREVKLGKMTLEQDVEKARQELNDKIFGGIETPKVKSKEELEREYNENVASLKSGWKPRFDESLKMKTMPVSIKGNDGSDLFSFDVDISSNVETYLKEFEDNVVTRDGISADQVPEDYVRQYIENRYWNDNRNEIIRQVAVKARAMDQEAWQKTVLNFSKPQSENVRPESDKPKTTQDEVNRALGDFDKNKR